MVTNFPNQVVGGSSEGKGKEAYLASSQQEVQTSTLLYNFLGIGYMAAFFHTGAFGPLGKRGSGPLVMEAQAWTISRVSLCWGVGPCRGAPLWQSMSHNLRPRSSEGARW